MYTRTLVPRSLCIRLETPGIGTNLRELGVREVGTNGLEPGDERMNSNIYHIYCQLKKSAPKIIHNVISTRYDMIFMATLLQCVVQQHAWLDDGVMSFLLVPVEESCRCSKCRSFTKEPVWEKSVPAVHTHV